MVQAAGSCFCATASPTTRQPALPGDEVVHTTFQDILIDSDKKQLRYEADEGAAGSPLPTGLLRQPEEAHDDSEVEPPAAGPLAGNPAWGCGHAAWRDVPLTPALGRSPSSPPQQRTDPAPVATKCWLKSVLARLPKADTVDDEDALHEELEAHRITCVSDPFACMSCLLGDMSDDLVVVAKPRRLANLRSSKFQDRQCGHAEGTANTGGQKETRTFRHLRLRARGGEAVM